MTAPLQPAQHQLAAGAAVKAAEALRDSPWHVVALHYAALHLLMADLAVKTDLADEDMRYPEKHSSRWNARGQRSEWGINDVVRAAYDSRVSRAFTELCTGSYTIRYRAPVPLGDRFWAAYKRVRQEVNGSATP